MLFRSELKGDYAYAYNNRSAANSKKKNYQLAANDANKAIMINEEYGEAYLNLGIAKEMLKDLEGACSDWQDAFILGSENAEQYINSPACAGQN